MSGLYLHWPFSRTIPPYCDFNHWPDAAADEGRWCDALARAIRAHGDGRAIGSVFVGGGTPSLLSPSGLAALLDAARAAFALAPDAEITLEADPDAADRFAGYRDAGVNRLSLRGRSLDARGLAFMQHGWSPEAVQDALAAAAATFSRVTIDLHYGWPAQTLADWRAELDAALGHGSKHLSIYDLAPLPGTAFAAQAAAGTLCLADGELREEMYFAALDHLAANGLPAYETANFAAPGYEARHNLNGWRGGDYLGIGPGAIGRRHADGARLATRQHWPPPDWLAAVAAGGDGTAETVALTPAERVEEALVTGLRMRRGLTRTEFVRIAGREPEAALPAGRLDELRRDGLLILDGAGLRLSERGWPLLDAVVLRLCGA